MNSQEVSPHSRLLLEIEEACLYRFDKRIRSEIAVGPCEIFESSETENVNEEVMKYKTMFLKIEDFCYLFSQSQVLIRQNYEKRVCYFFYGHELQLYCLSFDKSERQAENFAVSMGQALCIVDLSSELLDPELRERIVENCPKTLLSEDISYDSKRAIKSVGSSIGYAAGTLNRIFHHASTPRELSSLNEKSNRSENEVVDNESEAWNKVKETSESINKALTVVVSPAVTFLTNIAKNIGEQFYASENTVIKGIRENCLAIEDSINKAERKAKEEDSGRTLKKEEVSVLGLR